MHVIAVNELVLKYRGKQEQKKIKLEQKVTNALIIVSVCCKIKIALLIYTPHIYIHSSKC